MSDSDHAAANHPSILRAHVELLLEIAATAKPFSSDHGQAFVSLPLAGVSHQVFTLRDGRFRDWLIDRFCRRHEILPDERSLRRVLRLFEARAHCGPARQPVARRTLSVFTDAQPPAIVLHLGNERGEAVEIRADRWQVVPGLFFAFRQSRGALPLPTPSPLEDGPAALAALRSLLNLASAPDWVRCLLWLFCALRPDGPYPVLVLEGPAGSGKSFAARCLRALVDPSTAPLLPLPASERALLGLAQHSWVLAFDHVSSIPDPLASALCRLSSGGGCLVREPFDHREELRFTFHRPILITAAPGAPNRWLARPDLAARALVARSAPISPDRLRSEQALFREFETSRPHVFGALCGAIQTALARGAETDSLNATRLPDAAEWCIAAAPALGLAENEILSALDSSAPPPSDPVSLALVEFMQERPSWNGTATELLARLRPPRGDPSWPATPKGISERLQKASAFLEVSGFRVEFLRTRRGRAVRVTHHDPKVRQQ